MAERKYEKYIVTRSKGLNPLINGKPIKDPFEIGRVDGKIIEGAFYTRCFWYFTAGQEKVQMPPHTHDWDEVLAYFGSNPEDPHDLCGELEFWIDDEKYTVDESCIIYIPRGLKHCPFKITRINRPIFHFNIGTGSRYSLKKQS